MAQTLPKIFHLAVFCSGGGSNAAQLMHRFARHPFLRVSLMVANKEGIGAIEKAEKFQVPVFHLPNAELKSPEPLAHELKDKGIDYIALAGFLRKIPAWLIEAYPNKIFNIHPSLLPSHGGKGMYGMKVHQSVVETGDLESGMTVHLIDNHYDQGQVLYQAKCPVKPGESPEELQKRVLALEHEFYGHVVESYVAKQEGIVLP